MFACCVQIANAANDRANAGSPAFRLGPALQACLAIHVARRIWAKDALEVFAGLMTRYGIPEHIRSDNGPEMVAEELRDWLQNMGAKSAYIAPGSPWKKATVNPSMDG